MGADGRSSRPRALVTAPARGDGLDRMHELLDVVYDPWIEQTPLRILGAEQLAARLVDEQATIVVCEADECRGPVLELPLIAVGSTRGDPTNVDVAGATAAGIPVLHAPGRNADAVAEMTVALLFAAARHLVSADADVRAGEVFRDGTIPYQRFRAWELNRRTVGLIGLGAVGRATRWRLEGLGMRVIAFDPFNDEAEHSLEDLLAESDVVSVHAPVTSETVGMLDAAAFERMKPGAIFVNSARAAIHDLDALTQALESGHLAGAALDHFEGEVLPTDHPITALDNVVLTPHVGGATYDTEANHTRLIAEDLERLLEGARPRHIVNPEVLDA